MTLTNAQRMALNAVRHGAAVPRTLAMLEAFASLVELGLIAPERNEYGDTVRWKLTLAGESLPTEKAS